MQSFKQGLGSQDTRGLCHTAHDVRPASPCQLLLHQGCWQTSGPAQPASLLLPSWAPTPSRPGCPHALPIAPIWPPGPPLAAQTMVAQGPGSPLSSRSPIHASIHPSMQQSFHPTIHPYTYPCMHATELPSFLPFFHPTKIRCIHPSTHPSFHPPAAASGEPSTSSSPHHPGRLYIPWERPGLGASHIPGCPWDLGSERSSLLHARHSQASQHPRHPWGEAHLLLPHGTN